MKNLLFLLVFLFSWISALPQQKTLINSTLETVYPIQLPPNNLQNELGNLKDFFLEKTIVGMGEATHGTHEFFELKAKTFQFLVTECNYKIFGIEASYGAMQYVNEYVKNGKGSLQDIYQYFDWPWDTQELFELIEWIKNYNQNKKESEKVSFYGFDMQNLTFGLKYLSSKLSMNNSPFARSFQFITASIDSIPEGKLFERIRQNDQPTKDTLLAMNSLLQKWLSTNKQTISSVLGDLELNNIRLCLENYNQFLESIYRKNKAFHFRDSCMANNALKIQQMENSKMFIWAHNGHVGLDYNGFPIMGTFLKKSIQEKYYSIGFVFDHGSFMAFKGPNTMVGAFTKYLFARNNLYKGLMECSAQSLKKNTLTNELKKARLDALFIDLNSSSNCLFSTPNTCFDIGASYLNEKHASTRIVAKKTFDGLIYISTSSPALLLKR